MQTPIQGIFSVTQDDPHGAHRHGRGVRSHCGTLRPLYEAHGPFLASPEPGDEGSRAGSEETMGTQREDAIPRAARPTARQPTRLVLVDDDERTVHVLLSWLESLGFDVRAFTSPHDAIDYVSREGADVVITGSHVADMSGVRICESIRDASERPPPAFVGLATTSEGVEANDPMFDAVLRKPCSLDTLLNEISQLVPRPS